MHVAFREGLRNIGRLSWNFGLVVLGLNASGSVRPTSSIGLAAEGLEVSEQEWLARLRLERL